MESVVAEKIKRENVSFNCIRKYFVVAMIVGAVKVIYIWSGIWNPYS